MKKIKSFILIFFFIFLLSSCSSIKYIYHVDEINNYEKISSALKNANYISEKEFYLVFTKDFFEFPVKIIENEKIMFDGIITTKSNNIAKSFKLKYNCSYQIELKDQKDRVLIIPEKIKNYKYVYINKNKNKIIVNFNNGEKIK